MLDEIRGYFKCWQAIVDGVLGEASGYWELLELPGTLSTTQVVGEITRQQSAVLAHVCSSANFIEASPEQFFTALSEVLGGAMEQSGDSVALGLIELLNERYAPYTHSIARGRRYEQLLIALLHRANSTVVLLVGWDPD